MNRTAFFITYDLDAVTCASGCLSPSAPVREFYLPLPGDLDLARETADVEPGVELVVERFTRSVQEIGQQADAAEHIGAGVQNGIACTETLEFGQFVRDPNQDSVALDMNRIGDPFKGQAL